MKCNECGMKLRGVFVVSDGVPYCESCFEDKVKEPEKTCTNCKHADYYPLWYWFFEYDPYCRKGHGLCRIDRTCSDFEMIGRNSR